MSERVRAPEVLFQLSGVEVVETEMSSGRFRRANAAFCEMVGYSEAELRGMTYLELTHPDGRARDAERFAALGQGEHRSSASLTRLLRKDGGLVWLELHVTLVGEGDEALNLTVVNDVTERVCSEATVRASHNGRPRSSRASATPFTRWTPASPSPMSTKRPRNGGARARDADR